MSSVALYVHVPFCGKICPYCHFYKQKWSASSENDYVQALITEIKFYGARFPNTRISSIFFGGGTPNLLKTAALEQIMTTIDRCFSVEHNAEVTMEMNPGISAVTKLKNLYQLGIQRASLGIQSFNDNELQFLGRNHRATCSELCIDAVRTAGFKNMSIDIIYGLPHSNLKTLTHTLDKIMAVNPEHISTYGLTIEPNTPFKRRGVQPTTEDMEIDQYHLIKERVEQNGYRHYELSNFAKPGHECQHNLAYWEYKDYIGLGPGAHSFFMGSRYKHARDLNTYLKEPVPRAFRQKSVPKHTKKSQIENYLMCQLRLCRPLDIQELNQRFNVDFTTQYRQALSTLDALSLGTYTKKQLALTEKGRLLLNSVIELF